MTAEQKAALVAQEAAALADLGIAPAAAAQPGKWARFRAAVFGPNMIKMYMSAIWYFFSVTSWGLNWA
jgi:hypothetical protein